jgi:hypothetical protein
MRERHIPSLKNIDRHDRHRLTQVITTLPVVGLGDNRISTLRSFGWLVASLAGSVRHRARPRRHVGSAGPHTPSGARLSWLVG